MSRSELLHAESFNGPVSGMSRWQHPCWHSQPFANLRLKCLCARRESITDHCQLSKLVWSGSKPGWIPMAWSKKKEISFLQNSSCKNMTEDPDFLCTDQDPDLFCTTKYPDLFCTAQYPDLFCTAQYLYFFSAKIQTCSVLLNIQTFSLLRSRLFLYCSISWLSLC